MPETTPPSELPDDEVQSEQAEAVAETPVDRTAATEAGIKRGSTVAELKAAYEGKGLKNSSKTAYELPVTSAPGWTILFELKGDTVQYMSIGKAS